MDIGMKFLNLLVVFIGMYVDIVSTTNWVHI